MITTHKSHDKPATCDIPGCNGRREILIIEDEMRCVCRKCFRQMEGAAP